MASRTGSRRITISTITFMSKIAVVLLILMFFFSMSKASFTSADSTTSAEYSYTVTINKDLFTSRKILNHKDHVDKAEFSSSSGSSTKPLKDGAELRNVPSGTYPVHHNGDTPKRLGAP